MEGVPNCRDNIPFLNSVAVLESNSVYRMTDLLTLQGMRYRLDSVSILCDGKYSGTLLHEVLKRTSTLDGCLLDVDGYEHAWCGQAGVEVSRKPGWPRCVLPKPSCAFSGGSQLAAALSSRSEGGGVGGTATMAARRGSSGLVLGGAVTFAWPFESDQHIPTLANLQIETLHQVLAERQAAPRTRCEPAASDTLVIPLRMGDRLPARAEDVVVQAQAVLHKFPATLAKLEFTGVMHYGDNIYESSVGDNYQRTAQSDANNLAWLAALTGRANEAGLAWALRSEPIADLDLCYLVFSPRVLLPPGRGFGTVIARLRRYGRLSARRVASGAAKSLTCTAPNIRPGPRPEWQYNNEWGHVTSEVTCVTDGEGEEAARSASSDIDLA